MGLIELKCKNCGGQLYIKNDKIAICDSCGSKYILEKDNGEVYSITLLKENNRLLYGLVFMVLIGLVMFVLNYNGSSAKETKTVNQPVKVEAPKSMYPKSELLQAFLLTVYDKDNIESIKAEDMDAFKYLSIRYEQQQYRIDYSMKDYFEAADFDSSIKTLYFDQDLSKGSSKDLVFFHNLTYLNGVQYSLSDESLKFPYLKGLVASNEVSGLLTWLEPQQLLLLDITINEQSIDGIEKFNNLKELKLSADDVSNFTPLSGCRQLTKLTIEADDFIDKGMIDLNVISSLELLEYLEIKSNKLKSADFLKDLKKLTHLSLEDTLVLDLSCIKNLDTLTYLSLIDNDTVKDYSAISGLIKLNTLKLSISSKQSFPNASKISQLTSLYVDSLDDLSVLKHFPKLITLTLSYANISNTSGFNGLKELEALELKGAYGDFRDLDFLYQMPKLKTLDLSGMTFYTEIDGVFNIPTLESLNLNECSMGLKFERIKQQNKLIKLHMNKVKLYTNISVYSDGIFTNVDYDDCNLEDNIGFLSKFQNLEYLTLAGNNLSNINFVEQLPNLKQLDINDNYVTDIRPLAKLKDFKVLWCKGNPISQGTDLNSRFRIITQ